MAQLVRLAIAGSKLSRYLLDEDHEVGGSKAKFFLRRGFTRKHPHLLAQALNDHAASSFGEVALGNPADGRSEKRLAIIGPLTCPDGTTVLIKAIWQYDDGGDTAHFHHRLSGTNIDPLAMTPV